jgi:putative transposase
MTGLARVVVSGLPHHVTQRGNRREPIFIEDGDQEIYRDLLGEQARKAEVEVWGNLGTFTTLNAMSVTRC